MRPVLTNGRLLARLYRLSTSDCGRLRTAAFRQDRWRDSRTATLKGNTYHSVVQRRGEGDDVAKPGAMRSGERHERHLDPPSPVCRDGQQARTVGCYGIIHEAAADVVAMICVVQVYSAQVRYLFQRALLPVERYTDPIDANAHRGVSCVPIRDVDGLTRIPAPVAPDPRVDTGPCDLGSVCGDAPLANRHIWSG